MEMTITFGFESRYRGDNSFRLDENDFGLHVNHHNSSATTCVANSAARDRGIRLSNVNGQIEIRHASDGRALSPAKDLGHRGKDDDDSEI